ncbi:MAG TPA: immunoglobulin domain-containing protein [Chthoniobacteraceae bacterium]|nr:immunoglobulin domain-containing protein [Chthoniobacteraceae bacterium]
MAGTVVTINADKVMVLDGREVFPITMSPGPPTNGKTPLGDDALKELGDAGALMFRITQTTNWDATLIAAQQAALDWAAAHGMYCLVNLRELSAFASGDAATEAELRSVVNQFKNHSALGVWKNKDEAWWGGTSAADLQRGYDVIKQEDTNHPIEQTHAPRGTVADLQPYNSAADILALDIYPVGVPPGANSLLANKEISMVGDYAQFLDQVGNGQKQFWMVEQIAWSGVTPPAKTLVFPTPRQSRYMAYQAIANGARGLMFFGGNIAATLNAQDAPLGWNWTFWNDVLEPIVREIGDHSPLLPALVAPDSALPVTISGATFPDIEFRVRDSGPYLYIIATKREGATANVTFSGLPAWAATGEVLYESPRTVPASGGQFTDTFAPFDVHVYRFAQSPQAPSILYPPQGRANFVGTKATFTVFADGTGPLTYQWRKNSIAITDGGDVSGATTPVLTLASVAQSDSGSYDVVVSHNGSITSTTATLSVLNYAANQIPTITDQPQSRTNFTGTTATFSATVTGNGPFAYRWRKNGADLHDGAHISGATTWMLTLANVSPFDAADYDVVVTGATSVTSNAATLTVATEVGQLLLYEPFNYANIGGLVTANTPSNWATNGAGGPDDMAVVAGSLSFPGLAAPVGNSAVCGGAGPGVRRLAGVSVSSGVVYFSALFRMNDIGTSWNGVSSQIGALTAPDNVTFRCQVMARAAGSGFNLGVQKGGTGATATFGATEFHTGETILLVGKYDFTVSPNVASLWVNPSASTFGGANEPATAPLFTTTGTDPGVAIDRFNFRQNTASSVPAAMQWDELRLGRTWSDVTPPPLPMPANLRKLPGGAFSFDYLNSSARTYSVHASETLTDWSPIGSATEIAPGVFEFTDPAASGLLRRFYQLRTP